MSTEMQQEAEKYNLTDEEFRKLVCVARAIDIGIRNYRSDDVEKIINDAEQIRKYVFEGVVPPLPTTDEPIGAGTSAPS